MLCEVAALPFQAHANYGTWSIDFGYRFDFKVSNQLEWMCANYPIKDNIAFTQSTISSWGLPSLYIFISILKYYT